VNSGEVAQPQDYDFHGSPPSPKGEWKKVALEDCIAEFIDYRGKAPPKSVEGVPLITARNVKEGFLDFTSQEFIEKDKYSEWVVRGTPCVGDVLFTTEAPLGNACMYPEGQYAVAQRLITLKPRKDKLIGKYLMYYLLSEEGKLAVQYRKSGSTALGIKQSELRKVEILLPSLDEQDKIAETLSCWDSGINLTRGVMSHILNLRSAFLNKIFDNHTSIDCCSLEDVVELIYGKSPKDILTPDGKFPVIGTGGIVGKTNQALYESPSIVVGRKGTIDRPMYVDSPFWAIDTTYYVKPKEPIDMYWLLAFFQSLNLASLNESSGVPSLLRETLYSIEVRKPTLEKQAQIGLFFKVIDQELMLLEKKLGLLLLEKQALMQKLLTGKIRVKV
jgi:type I restriction enzyme S subunit